MAPVDCLQWLVLSIVVVSSWGSTTSSGSCRSSPVAPVLSIVVSSGSCRSSPVAPVDRLVSRQWLLSPVDRLVQWLQWLLSIIVSSSGSTSGSCRSSCLHQQWLLLIVLSPVAPVDCLVSSGYCRSSHPVAPVNRLLVQQWLQWWLLSIVLSRLHQWLLSVVSSPVAPGVDCLLVRPVAPVAPVDHHLLQWLLSIVVSSGSCRSSRPVALLY